MALLLEAFVCGKHAGQHAAHGVRQSEGRQFAAREHEIAQRNLLIHIRLQHAVIHTLVMAAEDDEILHLRELAHALLRQRFSLWRHKQDMRPFSELFHEVVQAGGDRLSHEEHAHAAAEERIVHAVVLVAGKIAELVAAHLQSALAPGAADDAFGHHRLAHIRKKGEQINPHRQKSP